MKEWYAENLPFEGKKCYEVYQNKNTPCDPCPTLRCMKSGKTERNIVPGLPGSVVEWIELFSYPMKDPETGKINGAVEFVRNITDWKKAEEALQKSEGKYRLLSESSQDGIYIIGAEGFEYVNPAFEKIFEYKAKEVYSKDFNFLDTIHPDDKKKTAFHISLQNHNQIRKNKACRSKYCPASGRGNAHPGNSARCYRP
jgi:PAS domain S-box-containing protein